MLKHSDKLVMINPAKITKVVVNPIEFRIAIWLGAEHGPIEVYQCDNKTRLDNLIATIESEVNNANKMQDAIARQYDQAHSRLAI